MTLFLHRLRHPRSLRLVSGVLVAITIVSFEQFAGAQEASKTFAMHAAAKPVAAISFTDGNGQMRSLADFKNKVVVLNIWATWCVPCRREMPALDRLQVALGGPDFEVVPLSIDRGGKDVVGKFFAAVGIRKLTMYLDNSATAMRGLGVLGLPTTLLIDREGREIGWLIGSAEWDSHEDIEFLRCVISTGKVAQPLDELNPATTPVCGKYSVDVPAARKSNNRQP